MDVILENNGEVAIVRGYYKPLEPETHYATVDNIGYLWQIRRINFSMSVPTFLLTFPVGGQINQ